MVGYQGRVSADHRGVSWPRSRSTRIKQKPGREDRLRPGPPPVAGKAQWTEGRRTEGLGTES